MHPKSVAPSLAILAGLIVYARGETHTVHFDNRCGFGTPTLVSGGDVLSTGEDFTTNGPLNAVAYLQTGSCGLNGENCTTVDISLANTDPSDPSSESSAAIDISPPHAFSGPTEFEFYNGCDGTGENCTSPDCQIISFGPPPPGKVTSVVCQADNVNVAITFCD